MLTYKIIYLFQNFSLFYPCSRLVICFWLRPLTRRSRLRVLVLICAPGCFSNNSYTFNAHLLVTSSQNISNINKHSYAKSVKQHKQFGTAYIQYIQAYVHMEVASMRHNLRLYDSRLDDSNKSSTLAWCRCHLGNSADGVGSWFVANMRHTYTCMCAICSAHSSSSSSRHLQLSHATTKYVRRVVSFRFLSYRQAGSLSNAQFDLCTGRGRRILVTL